MKKTYKKFLWIFSLLCLIGWSGELAAQTANARVSGTVKDSDGSVIPGASISVVNEATGFKYGAISKNDGSYDVRNLPLGGPYKVEISFIGFQSVVYENIQLSLGANFRQNVTLVDDSLDLETFTINSNSLLNDIDRMGGTKSISAQTIKELPVQDRNFTNLASLSPLTGRNLTASGQRAISTNFTVDGMNARGTRTGGEQGRGPFSISMEAIREFEVQTNAYDVTVGRQGGGGINAATKSGTNTWEGSAFSYVRTNALTANQDFRGREINDSFSNVQWGFTLGGPIVKDKAHIFVAFDRQDANRPVDVADIRTESDELALNLTRNILDQVVDIGREKYGVSQDRQTGIFDQLSIQNALFTRLDWQINDKNTLTFVNNFTLFNEPMTSGGDRLAILESRPERYSLVNTARLALRTKVTPNWTNNLQFQVNYSNDEARQDIGIVPRIFVRATSDLPDGTTAQREIQLGGHRWSPNYSNERVFQIQNISHITKGKYNWTFGADLMTSYHDVWISSEQFGLFEFETIQDFDNLNPFRYSRLAPTTGEVETGRNFFALDWSAFGQVDFNINRDVELMLGLRYDFHTTLNAPDYNPELESRFGVRNDQPSFDPYKFQPRVQATWNVGGNNTDFIKLGGGAFASQLNYYAFITNFLYTGQSLASVVLTGDDVPTPDFNSYRNDPSTIPGVPAGAGPQPTRVAYNADGLRTPMTWKANISYNKFVTERLRLGASFNYLYVSNNYHYFDRNLQEFFTVDPDNRPVFVPAESITSAGNTTYRNGRQFEEFEEVLEQVSEAKAEQYAAVFEMDYAFANKGSIYAAYTYNVATENSPYNGNNAISAVGTGLYDPRQLQWAPANNDFRHKIVVHATLPPIKGFVLSGSYVGITGAPITLKVNRDINGNGSSGDDLAFIFDPNDPSTPENIREGMINVLNNPENILRDYIADNLGTRANRNGAFNPFYGIINLRLHKSVPIIKNQRLELSADVFNFANLLNNEWGASSLLGGNQTLLNVTGFNQDTQQYQYRVNENVGRGLRNGTPYQIQVGARYTF